MRRTIYDKMMSAPGFRAVYEEIAGKMAIGEMISEMRHKKNMTQTELARKVGTSRTAIARYESGNYNRYSIVTLQRIAKALGRKLTISFS